MKYIINKEIKPKPPIGRIIYLYDLHTCLCGSSYKRKFFFFKSKKCINP